MKLLNHILRLSCTLVLVQCMNLNGGTVHFDNDEIYRQHVNIIPPRNTPPTTADDSSTGKPIWSDDLVNRYRTRVLISSAGKPSTAYFNHNKIMFFKSMKPGNIGGIPVCYCPCQTYTTEDSNINNLFPKYPSSNNVDIMQQPNSVNEADTMINDTNILNYARIKKTLQKGLIQMTLNMEKTIRESEVSKYENIVFSPVSIIGTLGMVLLGAEGDTKKEIKDLFGVFKENNYYDIDIIHKAIGELFDSLFKQSDSAISVGTDVKVANGVFHQERSRIKKQYQESAEKLYRTELYPLDFTNPASANFINTWVSNKTEGRIQTLLSGPLSPQTILIVSNVIYFNGRWEYPFQKDLTHIGSFEYHKSKTEKSIEAVHMMTNMETVYYNMDDKRGCQVLGLPYKGKEVYMYFILPKHSDLEKFTSNIQNSELIDMIESLVLQEVIYTIPKIKISNSIELKPLLNAMNVSSMFDRTKSDLSNMLENNGGSIHIDEIFHKVNIDINEEGTVAAASTSTLTTRMLRPTFRVNKPFISFIYHKPTKSILFWSSIYKPDPIPTIDGRV